MFSCLYSVLNKSNISAGFIATFAKQRLNSRAKVQFPGNFRKNCMYNQHKSLKIVHFIRLAAVLFSRSAPLAKRTGKYQRGKHVGVKEPNY